LWAKPQSAVAEVAQPLVFHADAGVQSVFGVDYYLYLAPVTGRVTFVMGAGAEDGGAYGFELDGPPLTTDRFTHIAVTVSTAAGNPAIGRLYIDGAMVEEATAWGGAPNSRQLSDSEINVAFADIASQRLFFNGQVDEVRFWSAVRSQAQIARDRTDPFLFADPADIPAGLVGYYSFDAGADDTVWDNSDQPWYDGFPVNGQQRVPADGFLEIPLSPLLAPFAGPEAYGLEFAGAGDAENFVELPGELSRALPRSMTFEAWVYLEPSDLQDEHYKTIVSRFVQEAADVHPGTGESGSNPEADFVLQVDPRNGRLVFFMGGGRGECEEAALGYGVALFSGAEHNVPAWSWHHVAFTIVSSTSGDPFSAHLYSNGELVPQAAELPGEMWRSECARNFLRYEPINLGYYDNGVKQFWDGRIDDVRFWSTAREAEDIGAHYMRPVPVSTPHLLASYPLTDGEGVGIHDAGKGSFHGKAVRPNWVLSASQAELLDGTSGFPVAVALQAKSLYPDDTEFTYILTKLPEHGGLFTDEEPIVLIDQSDVDAETPFAESLTYVSEMGFVGYDHFGYAAVSRETGLVSDTHYVYVSVLPYDAINKRDCVMDVCGVCNGDGTSCIPADGGCDGMGGVIDVCGVCGGNGGQCSCVEYKTFPTEELDCVLFGNSLNTTLTRVEHTIATLFRSLQGLRTLPQRTWREGFFDLGTQLSFLCDFNEVCLAEYFETLDEFEEGLEGADSNMLA
jgi:hypothetical protein